MQTVASLINPANSALCTVETTVSVCAAVALMSRLGVGALLVVDRDEGLVGILTERDVLDRVIAAELEPTAVTAGQVMTRELVTISPRASLEEAMELMLSCCQQQLLVADGSQVFGVVSIAEVTSSLVRDRDALIGDLTYYITH